jgi:ribosomal biogenesis protein LAS1
MSKYTITPWRTHTDLLSVRTQLYSTDTSAQRKAVNRVLAWKLRGNLPHAVESTALLVEAQLHHNLQVQTPDISSFSIRAVYTAAFTRFVTGFCDIGRAKERSLEPSSMLDIAKQIGMPTEFVALRHEATHEEMPGLRRLVEATERGLNWLWQVFWSKLEEPESEEAAEAAMAEFKTETASFLKEFRRIRRDTLKAKTKSADRETEDVEESAVECARACKGARSRIEALAAILVEQRLILPSTRE